uniref:Uncharacterized protein n=1 Tax=Molossus molossus TaxID=27622 RepID=A0A7J8HAT6_MOLMO|nr:hypothetical protein HJG59_004856 [Molossus molossus]
MGNITVDSSSGCLKASTHQSALDVYVSQLGKVELKSHKEFTGDVILTILFTELGLMFYGRSLLLFLIYKKQRKKLLKEECAGSILVKVASSLQAHLQLSGKEVDVNSEVHVQEMAKAHKDDGVIVTGLMNQGSKQEKWIKADAPKGTISFRSQSWFQSLKLQD